jgi:hypothetical protein
MSDEIVFNVSNNQFASSQVNMGKTIANSFGLPAESEERLLREVRALRAVLEERNGASAPPAVAALKSAESALAQHDPSGARAALAKAGTFALDCAKEIGTHLAEAALAGALNLGR